MNNLTALTPFRIEIPQHDLDDLHDRLARTRWPVPAPGRGDRGDFSRGIPMGYLKELADYWRDGFDWRAQEAKLNEYEQFTTLFEGQTFHVVHVRSANAAAIPLMLTHSHSVVFAQRLRNPLPGKFSENQKPPPAGSETRPSHKGA